MNQLEQLMGFDAFQKGLQQYLQTYRFGNADWDDLITILEHSTTKDLRTWSNIWVKEAGMPHYIVSTTLSADLRYHVTVDQKDPTGKNRIWPQYLTFTVHNNTYFIKQEIFTNNANITTTPLSTEPIYILPNITERGYGYFELDPKSKRYLLQNIQTISDPLIRGIVWLSLREMVIDHKIDPEDYFSTLCSSLKTEQEEQLINFLVTDIQMTYWKFLNPLQQSHVAESLPELLLTKLNTAETKSLKATYLKTLIYTTQKSCIGMDTLYAIWSGAHPIPGLKLSDNDYRIMACELAVRDYPDAKKVLATQIERIKDKDLRERLVYLLSSLSDNKEERDLFFHQLMNSAMREHEPWAAEALGYLNHPLREADSEGYILPGLNILEEIRATGDIFFPVDWLNALLSGHSSPEAARIVRSFLKTHPNYPPDLRLKILQSADNLLRRNPV
jgi:aminopeptidase N